MLSSLALEPRRVLASRWGHLLATFGCLLLFSLALCSLLGTPAASDLYTPPPQPAPGLPETGKSSIIIPTYHEAESLKALLKPLESKLPGKTEIIVVDDNSQDGTDKVVNNYAVLDGIDVRLITRTNVSGLSSAVLDGMAAAKGDIFLVMDADGQHPPAAAAAMLRSLRTIPRALIAMGTREKLSSEWPWYRRVLSWGASLLAMPLIGANVHDPMTGLFAIKAEVFHKSLPLNTSGFKIALELLLKSALRPGSWPTELSERVIELPYTFEARRKGSSKLGCKVVIQYAVQLFGLYYWRLGMLLPLAMASIATAALYILLSTWQTVRGRWRYEKIRRMSEDSARWDPEEVKGILSDDHES